MTAVGEDGRGSNLFQTEFVVPFADTDASTRTHFSALFRWVEAAEHTLLREVVGDRTTSFPRVRVLGEYLQPTRFADILTVRLAALRIGSTSLTYSWAVLRQGSLCATAEITAVHVDATDRPTPVPDALRVWLASRTE